MKSAANNGKLGTKKIFLFVSLLGISSVKVMRSALLVVLVFCLGLWFGPVVSTIGWSNALRGVIDAGFQSGGFVVLVLVALVLIYAFRDRLSALMFGRVRNRVETVLSRIFDVGDLSARAFHSRSLRRRKVYGARARQHIRSALEEFASAVIFTMGLRSLLGLLVGLMATFAATVGTYLLLEQNKLFSEQIQTIQDQALETLYLETFDTLQEDFESTPRAEARASLFFSRLPTPARRAARPEVSSQVDFRRCRDVKLQSVPDQVRGLLALDLSSSVVPTRLIDMTDFRDNSDLLTSAFSGGTVERVLADDVDISSQNGGLSSGGVLSRVQTRGASISFSSFASVNWPRIVVERGQIQDTCFDGSVLADGSFAYSSMRNVSFVNSDLDRANLSEGQRVDVNFSGARLRGSYFDQQTLRNVSFSEADLAFSRFGAPDENISFEDVSFSRTNLTGVVITQVEGWEVSGLDTACTHPLWPACIEGRGVLDLPPGENRCDAGQTPWIVSEILDSYFADHASLVRHLERYNACIRAETY